MKKMVVCLMSLLICCSLLVPVWASGEHRLDSLYAAGGYENETYIEHDAVTGEDTVFTLSDLNSAYRVNSIGSVSKYDSEKGIFIRNRLSLWACRCNNR